ncbi:MAG: beta-lactamase family protein [Cytophagales bacterium]|nr:beta-lactamase family protein [Cytophagales bacterium]
MKEKQTKRVVKIVFILASLGSLYFVPWVLIRAWLPPLPETVEEQVKEAVDLGLDGVLVYVDQAGRTPRSYAAGWHDRGAKIPADPKALFKIASVSKLYVAAAVAKLVNEQRLSLDQTLTEYLPELKGRIENADKITLKMLVQHRSGIPNFTDTPDYWFSPPLSNEDNLKLILDKPADFAPDEKYSYSNTNYLLIGEILNKTLGYSFNQYIKENILTPLGLNHTYMLFSEAPQEAVMSGYDVGFEGDLKSNDFINPSGSMVATAEDVGTFLRALNQGTLLNEQEQAIYTSIYQYEHTGLLPGFSSIARYYKDMDTVVVLFASTSGGYSWNISEIVYARIVKIVRNISAE